MPNPLLRQRIFDVLKAGRFADPNDLVDVSRGDGDNVHVVVVSRKFDGKPSREREEMLWSELTHRLPRELFTRVSLLVGVSPERIKAL
jgi:acid stress-induced BolA-like protein IbaG/YrbA